MDKKLFNELVESMTQMNEIIRGDRQPSRVFHIDADTVKDIRAATGLSQPKLAALMDIDVGTLRNWEQGRREPTGPAKALLRAIAVDPEHVLKALAAERSVCDEKHGTGVTFRKSVKKKFATTAGKPSRTSKQKAQQRSRRERHISE